MKEAPAPPDYKRHRFPPAIIGHAVWLYFRFALSYRDMEELLAERGVIVTYETVRQWCRKFGQQYANTLHKRRPHPGDKWLSWLKMRPPVSRGALVGVVQATQDGHRAYRPRASPRRS